MDPTADTAPRWQPRPLPRTARVYVAGHGGLVGSAVWRHLEAQGFTDLVGRTSAELDLRERDDVMDFFAKQRPDVVVLAAARVGGIMANATQPADFLSDNLRIQVNVLDAAAPQPIPESALLTGPLEPTNDAYAIAKIAGVLQVQALRRQHGLAYVSAMPTNLYGPGDNFSATGSHVLPALLRRFHEGRQSGAPSVTLWGTGTPRREFLHVDDLAAACLVLLERYDGAEPVNVGTGSDVTVAELAALVASVVGYDGAVEWDPSKPDGTPRKLLDVSRIQSLGWRAETSLQQGVAETYRWYLDNTERLKV
jgi:GDP-L-fucose synthase